MRYLYWVDGHFTENPYVAGLLQAMARLWDRPQAAVVISLLTTYDAQSEETAPVLEAFTDSVGSFGAFLRSAEMPLPVLSDRS